MSQFAVIAASALGLALALDPQPHSDWLNYWNAAGDIERYQRGGAALLPLALSRAAGLGPVASALCINLCCAAILLALAYRADRTPWKPCAQLIAGNLWLISPFFGIVQLDLSAATLLAASFFLALGPDGGIGRRAGIFLLAMAAVATKPQLGLVLWGLTGLLLLSRFPFRRAWGRRMDAFMAIMFAAALAGIAADYAVRHGVGQQESMRTSSAVTLYGGLLVSGTGIGCGYWSVEAANAAKKDMSKPLPEAVADRLGARPLRHWMQVVGCKLPQIVSPPPYALYWLVESPDVWQALQHRHDWQDIEKLYARSLLLERVAYNCLKLSILAVLLWSCLRAGRRRDVFSLLLPPLWILSFWAVHAVFEIQGRYFLPMYLLAPLLCAFALAGRGPVATERGRAGVPARM